PSPTDVLRRLSCLIPFQLTAGGVDIEPSRTPNETRRRPPHDLLERCHPLRQRRFKRNPGPGVQRDQIHFAVDVPSIPATRRASASVSFTPRSSTYSNVRCSQLRSGYARQASSKSFRCHFRVIGISS